MPLLALGLFAMSSLAAPPETKRLDLTETLHGVAVADPYRWLEEVDSSQTKNWVIAQSQYARQHLDALPARARIQQRLAKLSAYTRAAPFVVQGTSYAGAVKRGGRLFFLRQDPGQNQPVIYVRENSESPRALLDPNTLSSAGTAAISSWAPSPDGKWVVYGVSKAGSDWQEWRVRNVATGADLPDRIEWIKFSDPVWSADSTGFYYARYPEPEKGALLTAVNHYHKLYYHRLQDKQSADRLIYERPDQKEWGFDAFVTADGRHLLINARWGTRVERTIFVQQTKQPGSTRTLTPEFEADYLPIGSKGSLVYFFTSDKAPRGRVIAIDLDKPARENWKEIVAESKDTLDVAIYTGGRLICQYLQDARSAVKVFTPGGRLDHEVKLPGLGQANWSLNAENEPDQYFAFAGYTQPLTLYRYDLEKRQAAPMFTSPLPFDPAAFETTQVFYTSKDGTRIPMFLSHKKGLVLNGRNPALLYGYGGFNVAVRPQFQFRDIAWMEQGGIYAVANLRGGSEYGDAWHQAGMKGNKQNVFDDFIAAAEFLIAKRYTSAAKLGILGGSNGGLLVGACLNQRPDLFGAAIPRVGVMDMLRFHKFTIGGAWVSDYGSPDDASDFQVLMKYSPYHNIRRGTQYPATLIMTADHDDRVVPSHSFKYGAALQHAQEGKAPILLRIETSAGHGAGKPTSKIIEEESDVLAFLHQHLGM